MSIVARVEREKDSFFTLFLQQKVLHRSQKTKEELIEHTYKYFDEGKK